MAKKKRKKGKGKATPPKAPSQPQSFEHNAFDALKHMIKDKRRASKKGGRIISAATPVASKPAAPPPPKSLNSDELFAHAVGQLGNDAAFYDLKFGQGRTAAKLPAPAPDEPPKPKRIRSTPELRKKLKLAQEEALFEAEMMGIDFSVMSKGGGERISQNVIEPGDFEPERRSMQQVNAMPIRDLYDELLEDEQAPLSGEQRALVKRARQHLDKHGALPEINLRGMGLTDALRKLEDFLEEERRLKHRIVRVITGKGKRSKVEPVIKRTVNGYFEGSGAQRVSIFAPELNRDGNYGAILVQLRKKH